MRTKILLTAAAALAAGVVASNGQVYSANFVGYANVTLVGNSGYTLVANPFDDGNGNQSSNLVNALPNKSQVITWNGTGYNTALTKSASGWNGSTALPPGVGFFVKNGIAGNPPITNTFVGSVIVGSGGSVTNPIPVGLTLAGSPIPYAGDVTTDNANINLQIWLANKSQLIDWNTGTQLFDTAVTKSATGWNNTFPITVGQGFFIKAQTAGSNWVQTASF